MRDGLVSIITPTFNSANFIEETIKSVLSQTYSNWEMIIVDDCSGDNTEEVVSQYSRKDRRIKILVQLLLGIKQWEKPKGSIWLFWIQMIFGLLEN